MIVERRRFLKVAGAFAIASTLPGGCAEAPKQEEQLVPPAGEWSVIKVPSEIPPNGIFTINSAEYYQKPDIGLRGIHLYWRELYPIIMISTVWDAENLKRVYLSPKDQGREGRLGLQPITEPFWPDISLTDSILDTGNISKETATSLGLEAASLTTRFYEESSKNSVGSIVAVQKRPTDGRDYAVVFGEGYVDHAGHPSPLSYLAIRFQFENSQKPTQPT